MEKAYVVYEEYTQDYMNVNNKEHLVEIVRVFKDEDDAQMFVYNELEFQCSEDDDEIPWSYTCVQDDSDMKRFDIMYGDELQYTLVAKEIDVK